MDNEVLAKIGLSALLGSALSLRFMQGVWWMRILLFLASVGIGILGGGAAMESFHVEPGSYMHLAMVAASAVFGLSFINSALEQLPQWIAAARAKYFGGSQ